MPNELRPRKWLLICLAALAVLALGLYFIGNRVVAPRLRASARQRVQDYLSQRFRSQVEIGDFHLRLSPAVRVEVDHIALRHQGRTDIPPMIAIDRATFDANLAGLFGSKVNISQIRLEGLAICLPPRPPDSAPAFHGSDTNLAQKYPVVIHEIVADHASLTMLRRSEDRNRPPNRFEIYQLKMEDFAFDRPAGFQALLSNPKPAGLIHTNGQFGPWTADDPATTPVDGIYMFQDADMGTLKGLKGTMQSNGQFRGPLDYLQVDGQTRIPDFALRTSSHPVALDTDYSAVVDGTNGNTILKQVTARFGHTILSVQGEVVDLKKSVKGRTIELHAQSSQARIEDLLALAVNTAPPAMTGPAKLDARIDIPEADTDLLDRMKLDGRFGVGEIHFTSAETQSKVDSLSRRGQGAPKDWEIADQVSSLQGQFKMADSTITMSNLNFAVEGADISLAGTYQLDDGTLDFRGQLRLDAKLSQTTTGVKSLFLKAVDPFFSKHGAGTDLPIKINGTKDHPSFGLDFHDKENPGNPKN